MQNEFITAAVNISLPCEEIRQKIFALEILVELTARASYSVLTFLTEGRVEKISHLRLPGRVER